MASTIQPQVDDELKACVFPFEIKRAHTNPYGALSEAELLDKLKKSRQNIALSNYRDASDVSHDMRVKYGL